MKDRLKQIDSSPRTAAITAVESLLNTFSAMVAQQIVNIMREQDAPRLLNTREAGAYLRRSERWVRQETAAGRLECVREGKSRPRYDRAALDRYVEQRNGRD